MLLGAISVPQSNALLSRARTLGYIAFAHAPQSVARAAPRLWPEHKTLQKAQAQPSVSSHCQPRHMLVPGSNSLWTELPYILAKIGPKLRLLLFNTRSSYPETVTSRCCTQGMSLHQPAEPGAAGTSASGIGAHRVMSAGRKPVMLVATASSVYPGSRLATTDWNARRNPRCTYQTPGPTIAWDLVIAKAVSTCTQHSEQHVEKFQVHCHFQLCTSTQLALCSNASNAAFAVLAG